jgi:hypothetical protein
MTDLEKQVRASQPFITALRLLRVIEAITTRRMCLSSIRGTRRNVCYWRTVRQWMD